MSPSLDIVAVGVPLFAVAIAIESWLGRRRNLRVYHLPTALSDIACGAAYTALDVALRVLTLGVYLWVYEHCALVHFAPDSPWPWVIGILGVDFGYYAWHRLSHVVNALWAVHVVHHQSEDYNFAVALRQPLLEPLTWMPLFALLAIAGVPFEIYFISFTGNLFFQFWLHTELVDRLPAPVEWIFNTPSHHRVHHGVESQYLDRNYGGVLIIWDRLLGTFTSEGVRPTYGTTTRLHSFNPLWGNAVHWVHIGWLWRHATTWADKLRALVAHPGWRPSGTPAPAGMHRDRGQPKYRPRPPSGQRRALMASFAVVMALVVALELQAEAMSVGSRFAVAGVCIVSLVAVVARSERRRWAGRLEIVRIVGLGIAAGMVAAPTSSLAVAVAVAVIAAVLAAAAAGRGWTDPARH